MADLNDHFVALSKAVAKVLEREKIRRISGTALHHLFQTMYLASLQTEEAERFLFHLVCIDPENSDPNPPQRIVRDRWRISTFESPIKLADVKFIKIALATDPRTSSFAIWPTRDSEWVAWGMVDQQNRYHEFVNYDSRSGSERPGIFEATALGPGHVIAMRDYCQIAELRIDRVANPQIDVFRKGPVFDALSYGISKFLSETQKSVGTTPFEDEPFWNGMLVGEWIATLSRLILRIRSLSHGGALIIVPNRTSAGLNIKMPLRYDRMRTALGSLAVTRLLRHQMAKALHANEGPTIPSETYWNFRLHDRDERESERELDGAIWFSALLSRVDGSILLTQELNVRGFGVEIATSRRPDQVYVATTAQASRLKQLDYNHFGTRHRSMMRFCNQTPNAIGIVISQDGGVRVIHKVAEKLVVWDNVKLTLHK